MGLTLLCGLSFSGKSTLAAQLVNGLNAELISLDAINQERGLDGGKGIPLQEWSATNRIAHDRASRLLRCFNVSASTQIVLRDLGMTSLTTYSSPT